MNIEKPKKNIIYQIRNSPEKNSPMIVTTKSWKYIGNIKNNLFSGYGKLFILVNKNYKLLYKGLWLNNVFHGKGEYFLDIHREQSTELSTTLKTKKQIYITNNTPFDNQNNLDIKYIRVLQGIWNQGKMNGKYILKFYIEFIKYGLLLSHYIRNINILDNKICPQNYIDIVVNCKNIKSIITFKTIHPMNCNFNFVGYRVKMEEYENKNYSLFTEGFTRLYYGSLLFNFDRIPKLVKNGKGIEITITRNNSFIYEGFWKNNKKNGKGIWKNEIITMKCFYLLDNLYTKHGIVSSKNFIYLGPLQADQKVIGKIFFRDGQIYHGPTLNFSPHFDYKIFNNKILNLFNPTPREKQRKNFSNSRNFNRIKKKILLSHRYYKQKIRKILPFHVLVNISCNMKKLNNIEGGKATYELEENP